MCEFLHASLIDLGDRKELGFYSRTSKGLSMGEFDVPCSYDIFQYLFGYLCVVLNIFWYDFCTLYHHMVFKFFIFFYVDERVKL